MTYVAIDIHKVTSTFAYVDPAREQVVTRRVYTRKELFSQELSGLPQPWVVAVEATRQAP